MAAPVMTYNAAGNIRASAALAASASVSYDIDASTKLELQLTATNTPGATIATTRGLRVECLARYGTTPSNTTIPAVSRDLPSQTASTQESATLFLPTGKWRITITNLDATNAVTAELTSATIDSIT